MKNRRSYSIIAQENQALDSMALAQLAPLGLPDFEAAWLTNK